MFFTQEDYKKIQQWLIMNSVKDTEFNEANIPFNGEETITIVQGNQNKKVFLKDLIAQVFNLGISDFVNITDKYDAPNISLEEAIRLIPSRARKEGQVITFLDMEDHWHIYQFKGVLNQWNVLDTWEDLFDWEKLIIDSILPDEEDLTKSLPDNNGNSYLSLKDREYNPEDFSGLGRIILRKNIVDIEDPIYGKVKKNVLYQDMFTQSNTIYEIRYDFDLNGQEITIPEGCILEFTGGKLENGTLVFIDTKLEGNICIRCAIKGSITNKACHINWFAEAGSKIADLMQVLFDNVKHIYIDEGTWYIDHLVQMKSGVTVEGIDKDKSIFKVDGESLNSLRGHYDMFTTLDHWIYRWDYADNNVAKEEIERQLNTILLSDVTFKNISFDGNKISLGDADLIKAMHKSCICFVNSIRCNVINCSFKEDFTLSHNEGTHAIQYIYSQDSIVDNCQAASVSLVCMDYSNNIIVSNCKVNIGTDAIIETRGGRGHIIEHNTFIDKLWTSSFVGINSPYCIIRHNYFVCTDKITVAIPLSMLTIGHEGVNVDASYTAAYDNTLTSEKQSRGIMIQSGVGVIINNNVIKTKVVSNDIFDSWAGIQIYGSDKSYNYTIHNNIIDALQGIGISCSSVGGNNIITNNKIVSKFGILTNNGSYHIKDNTIDASMIYTSSRAVNLEMTGNIINSKPEAPYTNNGAILINNHGILKVKDNIFNNLNYVQLIPTSNNLIEVENNIFNTEEAQLRCIFVDGSNLKDSDVEYFVIKNNIIKGYENEVYMTGLQSKALKGLFNNNKEIKSTKIIQNNEANILAVNDISNNTFAVATDIGCIGIRNGTRWVNPDGYTLARKRGTSAQFPTNLLPQDTGFIYYNTSDNQHYKAKTINNDGTAQWELLSVSNEIKENKKSFKATSSTIQTELKYNIIKVSSTYTEAIGIYAINKIGNEISFIAGEDSYNNNGSNAMYITYNSNGIVVNANEQAISGSWVLYIEELL